MNTIEAKEVLETALLCPHEPLSLNGLKKLYVQNSEDSREDDDKINADQVDSGRITQRLVG